jgi:uncharacterized glyoxalase superfamily protein PhnB
MADESRRQQIDVFAEALVLRMTKTFFSPRFGMVADRFGVSWMVYVAP